MSLTDKDREALRGLDVRVRSEPAQCPYCRWRSDEPLVNDINEYSGKFAFHLHSTHGVEEEDLVKTLGAVMFREACKAVRDARSA